MTLGVSRLHGEVSRQIFQPLFPRWPSCEVPVATSPTACIFRLGTSRRSGPNWTKACGKERWRDVPPTSTNRIVGVSDEELWAMRGEGRRRVVAGRARAPSGQATELARAWTPTPSGEADTRARSQRPDARLRAPLHRIQAAEPSAERSASARREFCSTTISPFRSSSPARRIPPTTVGKEMIQRVDQARRASRASGGACRVPRGLRHRLGAGTCAGRRSSGSTRRAGLGRPAAPAA